jgi:hypothetical protein
MLDTPLYLALNRNEKRHVLETTLLNLEGIAKEMVTKEFMAVLSKYEDMKTGKGIIVGGKVREIFKSPATNERFYYSLDGNRRHSQRLWSPAAKDTERLLKDLSRDFGNDVSDLLIFDFEL